VTFIDAPVRVVYALYIASVLPGVGIGFLNGRALR
jgi:hypothetical protein